MNDSILFNYNGFYHYSSLSGKNNKNFLTDFGIRHNLIAENASNTTLPMASLLGVKYYATENHSLGFNPEWYEKVSEYVYKNKYSLNLGYLVNNEIKNLTLTNNPLENQNNFLKSLTNTNDDVFEKINISDTANINKNINEEWYIIYKFKNNDTANLKLYIDNKLIVSNSEINNYNVVYIPKNISTIKIESKDKYTLLAYKYHHEIFENIYKKISTNQLKILSNKTNYIKATISVKKPQILLTSLINNKGWKIKIDGKKTDKINIANSLIGLNIAQGSHTIEFYYTPPTLYISLILSLSGVIWFILDIKKSN